MPKVVLFQIGADQPERAMKFYQDVFGWRFDGAQDFWFATTGDDNEPGIGGALVRRTNPSVMTLNYVNVPSVDQFAAKITQKGGQVVGPKMPFPGVGYLAYCVDTEGNLFGLFQSDPSAGTTAPVNVPTSIR